jgi:hypothetical protein
MSDERKISCDDCYFRRLGLCAIPGNTPCPTFRPVSSIGPVSSIETRPPERPVTAPAGRIKVAAAAAAS